MITVWYIFVNKMKSNKIRGIIRKWPDRKAEMKRQPFQYLSCLMCNLHAVCLWMICKTQLSQICITFLQICINFFVICYFLVFQIFHSLWLKAFLLHTVPESVHLYLLHRFLSYIWLLLFSDLSIRSVQPVHQHRKSYPCSSPALLSISEKKALCHHTIVQNR